MESLGHIVAPILILVLLGFLLGRTQFLGPGFVSDLNKLVFWVALPALLFRSVALAEKPGPQTFRLMLVLVAATLLVAALGWLVAVLLRLPSASRGTLAQSAFRGNLAFVSLPILAYAMEGRADGKPLFATAVIALTVVMAFYNVLSVVVLQASQHDCSWRSIPGAGVAILSNPLLVAALAGLPIGLTQTHLPLFLDRTLELLGSASVPVALLCVGGALAAAPINGSGASGVVAAALLKTVVLPVVVWVGAPWAGLQSGELLIAMVMAACPTAATAYVMVRQMKGDELLAARSIVLSSLVSFVAIPVCLWITR